MGARFLIHSVKNAIGHYFFPVQQVKQSRDDLGECRPGCIVKRDHYIENVRWPNWWPKVVSKGGSCVRTGLRYFTYAPSGIKGSHLGVLHRRLFCFAITGDGFQKSPKTCNTAKTAENAWKRLKRWQDGVL